MIVAEDLYSQFTPDPTGAMYFKGFAITPSDGNQLQYVTRGIYVGGTGDVTLVFVDEPTSAAITFRAVPVGTILPVRAYYVMSTNTTATYLVGLI